jgi:hypothetical protein
LLNWLSSIRVRRICFRSSIPAKVRWKSSPRYEELTVYTEVATRIALLYCAQILATGFSGLIAAGVFAGMDGLRGLAGWRWLFIV